MENPKTATQQLAKAYAERGEPDGWFEDFYARAGGDIKKVYWADLEPNPLLLGWLKEQPAPAGKRAITIGCGLGDDAELLSQQRYQVIAFDISPSAIAMCRQRYPASRVDYRVSDLFNYPAEWRRAFDLVYECNTIQILTGQARASAVASIAALAADSGEILVSCRSRNKGELLDTFPIALDRDEIDGFQRAGLSETKFVAYDDNQSPPVPHFFAVYQRLAGGSDYLA
jgi:SAM-dependent methyltransferase